MATPEFIYRPVLHELTNQVNDQGLDPYEAYFAFYDQIQKIGYIPDSYLSSSITSGGHARDESLQMRDIIARNTRSAYLLADQLSIDCQINPLTAIEPVAVGKTHWNQAQYMEFWLSVIGGVQFKKDSIANGVDALRNAAKDQFNVHGVDLDFMVSAATPEERAAEYFKMATAFAGIIKANKIAYKPVDKVVRMIDPDKSLGAQAERAFARAIGSKVMNIKIMKPATPSELNHVNHRLARDTARLISFGATVFDTRDQTTRLMLVEDDAA